VSRLSSRAPLSHVAVRVAFLVAPLPDPPRRGCSCRSAPAADARPHWFRAARAFFESLSPIKQVLSSGLADRFELWVLCLWDSFSSSPRRLHRQFQAPSNIYVFRDPLSWTEDPPSNADLLPLPLIAEVALSSPLGQQNQPIPILKIRSKALFPCALISTLRLSLGSSFLRYPLKNVFPFLHSLSFFIALIAPIFFILHCDTSNRFHFRAGRR